MSRNDAQAAAWFQTAADHGAAQAYYGLGLLYYLGSGVPQDKPHAVALRRRGAELGSPFSQGALGSELMDGHVVARNPAEAVTWFQRAAGKGLPRHR